MTEISVPRKTTRAAEPSNFRRPVRSSLGASDDAIRINNSLDEIEYRQFARPSARVPMPDKNGEAQKSLAEQLYDALANAKVLTSQVAMHLSQDWRDRLFHQLDDLLDADDWHDEDKPVENTSFTTFLRTIIHGGVKRRPGLGVSHRGNLIAAWTRGKDRLTMEFFPSDMVRWVLSCEIEGELERAAAETPVWRLPEVLRPYKPDRWFSDDGPQDPA